MNESDKDYENFVERMGTSDINLDALEDHLAHHGVLGMKWGVRRYQSKSGSLTPLGKKRQQYANSKSNDKAYQDKKKAVKTAITSAPGAYKNAMARKHARKREETKQQIELVKKGANAYKDAMSKKHDRKREETKQQIELVKKGANAYKNAMSKKHARKMDDTKKQAEFIKKKIGELEDKMTYGKKADKSKNASIMKEMDALESQLNSLSSKPKKQPKDKNYSDDFVQAREIKKKKVNQMSNEELRALNNRMQLETQYKDLQRRQVSSGQKIATGIIKDVGTEVAKSYVKDGLNKGIKIVAKEVVRR